jgi:hypothetical protein
VFLEKKPALHSEHVIWPDLDSPNLPAGQEAHDVDPSVLAVVPISQMWHFVISVSLAKRLAAHSLQLVLLLTSPYFPGTQGRHAA